MVGARRRVYAIAMRPVQRNILVAKLVVGAILAGVTGWIWWYELAVARPKAVCLGTPGGQWNEAQRSCQVGAEYTCEKSGGWWEPVSKTCAKVVSIPSITGRPNRPQGARP